MESTRRVTTLRQLEILVEFLREHPDLALGRLRTKEARATSSRLWGEITESLNTEGPARSSKEWTKVWNDLKCKVRAKLVAVNASQRGTGGGPNTGVPLSTFEETVAQILGRDVGPLQNVAQNHFVNNEENIENVEVGAVIELNLEHENVSPPILLPTDSPAGMETSPVPSTAGQAPTTPLGAGGPRRLIRGRERRRVEPISTSRRPASGRSALEDSRQMVLHIERLRAEAALENAKTRNVMTTTLVESVRLIAESIHIYTQRNCQQN